MGAAVRSVGQFLDDDGGGGPVPYPSSVAAGDLLLCIVWQDSDGSPASLTAPTGWAQTGATITTVSNSTPFAEVFVRTAAATGSESGSVTWPMASGSSAVAFMLAISGANVANPISGVLTAGSTGSASPVCPSVGSGSAPAAGDLLVCSIAAQSGTPRTQTTPPTGMTQAGYQATTWCYGLVDTQVLTASGPTGTRTATMNGAPAGPFRTLSIAIAQGAATPSAPTNLFMPFFAA
jgi:hypothetical protein